MRKIILLFIAAASWCAAATAQNPAQNPERIGPDDGFAERLAELSSRIESIECDFVQLRHVSVISGDVSRPGRFYYARPGNIRLEFGEPAGDMIVMDGRRFKIVNMGKCNVTDMKSNPMLSQMKDIFEACMTGDIRKLEQGSAVEYLDGGDTYIVVLKANNRRSRSYVESITLTFDKKDMSLSRLRMDEPSGDYTEYVFSDKKFNGAVDASKFEI